MYWYTVRYFIGAGILSNIPNFELGYHVLSQIPGWDTLYHPMACTGTGIF